MGGINAKSTYDFFVKKKYIFLTLFVIILFIIFSALGLFSKINSEEKFYCGDDTVYDSCSKTQPYFCSNGKLIDLASVCGCPNNFIQENESCISQYNEGAKEIYLNYVIRGRKYVSTFVVYEEFANYTSEIPRSIRYSYKDNFSRADFKLKIINEEEQREMILPLVIQIQNMTFDKDDQARIAISMVQNIPFGYSNKTIKFGEYNLSHSRYPYEVLYDMQGICGEKTELLILLLREIGYGTGFFYYPDYNHESVGIKCPIKESVVKSGYCFVETTGSSIISDDKIYYSGLGVLDSIPEFYLISYGKELSKNIYEYSDAEALMKIRSLVEENGYLWPGKRKMFEQLQQKYGLVEEYYSG